MKRSHRAVVLASGLPLLKNNSFTRQLQTLARALEIRGWKTDIAGRDPEDSGKRQDKKGINQLLVLHGPVAFILLGYPDQFPFPSKKTEKPLYLWSQFSHPPNPASLKPFIPVPLTEMTKIFLVNAGVSPIGPIIPHVVDSSFFHPLTAEEKTLAKKRAGWEGMFVVGAVGANTLRKKFDILIKAFALFYGKMKKARLLIKTDRINSNGGFDLENLVNCHGVSSCVFINTEPLSAARMADLYGSMDIYLHTAEWEGFGLPVIEAMACGLPVAAPPIQGPGEILPYVDFLIEKSAVIRDGSTVLRWADPENIVHILESAAANPGLCRECGARGRKEVLEKYDCRLVAEQWIELLSDSGIRIKHGSFP